MPSYFIWISCFILFKFSVVDLVASSTPWYNDTDHYWNMDKIYHGYLHDKNAHGIERWTAHIKGASEVTPSESNLGVQLYGEYSRIDLGSHNTSCYVDVANCTSGLSLTLWVKVYERGTRQSFLVFGRKNRGLSIEKTENEILEITLSSAEMRRTWTATSSGKVFEPLAWHHVGITWDSSVGLNLYLNGTRLENTSSATIVYQINTTFYIWSMYIGRNKQPIAVDELALWSRLVNNDTIWKSFKYRSAIRPSNNGCPSGWSANLQFCYREFSMLTTWSNAQNACRVKSSGLMSIISQEEDEFINNTKFGNPPCTHLGLTTRQGSFYWSDDSVWNFSRLGDQSNITANHNTQCVYRNITDSLWYISGCQRECGFVCKRYRAGVFRNADFYCHVKHLHTGISRYRVSIVKVRNQVECALTCLIHGTSCQSYNYQKYTKEYPEESHEHLCELNGSRDHVHLVGMEGYQYCERK